MQKKQTKLQKLELKRLMEKRDLMRKKVKNQLWPFLLKNAKSVEEAKMIVQAVVIGMEQAFENQRMEQKISALKLVQLLAAGDQKNKYNKITSDLVKMFEEDTITDALIMLKGMEPAIGNTLQEELKTRKLDNLKVEFL